VDLAQFYFAGLIMDRRGRKWAIVPPFIGQAVGMALVPFTASFGGLLGAASLIGFANGFSSGTMLTVGSDLAPEEGRGEFLGVWWLLGDMGVAAGPLLVGLVAGSLALSAAAWVLAAAGLAAALTFGLFVPETLKRPIERLRDQEQGAER
jgi:MFS family permease